MGRAHKLKLDHGQYCGSILGLGLSYMQPTMNPCGYLVVKQAGWQTRSVGSFRLGLQEKAVCVV